MSVITLTEDDDRLAFSDLGRGWVRSYLRTMTTAPNRTRDKLEGVVLRRAGRLSPRVQRRLSGGGSHVVDGLELHSEMRILLTLLERGGGLAFNDVPLAQARADMTRIATLLGGLPAQMQSVRDLTIPGPAGPLGGRLYTPYGDPGTLLVFFHGGGWTLGDLDSHDLTCRYLAAHSGTKVLAVDYRLAPEHPFPAAPDDAFAAFTWAHANADDLGVDADAIAVGGDSAGGNLAAGLCLRARDAGVAMPAFQLLLYPATDLVATRPSRQLFGTGYVLTTSVMKWYLEQYLPTPETALDPQVSPVLAADLTGLPAAYIATAGYDPIRDDGEAYADRLRESGVAVALRRHDGLIHGFAVATGYGSACPEAMREAAGALRTGIALAQQRKEP